MYWETAARSLIKLALEKVHIVLQASCLVTHPPQSVCNIISGPLEWSQQSGGETASSVAQLISLQSPAFYTFPHPIYCHFQLHSHGNDQTLKADADSPPFFPFLTAFLCFFFLSPVIWSGWDRSISSIQQLEAWFFRPGWPAEIVFRPPQHAPTSAPHKTHFSWRYGPVLISLTETMTNFISRTKTKY